MISSPAAAYPFPHASGDIFNRPFNPPSNLENGGTQGGRYVWGEDVNGDGTIDITDPNENIFPNIPPRPASGGEIPMLPGDFTQAISENNATNANNRQMRRDRPTGANRSLWFRTAVSNANYLGEGGNISYQNNNNLFINNLSFPVIGSGANSFRANLNSTGSLVLPPTPCINLSNGTVDDRCTTKPYDFNTSIVKAPDPDSTVTLLNLNLPYNPHFPSDNVSRINATSSVQPATSFTVCGGTGNTRNYQAIQRPSLSKTDISAGSCPQGANSPGQAIRNFVGTLPNPNTGTTLTGGTGLLSAKLNPGNTGADAFIGLVPNVTNSTGVVPLPATADALVRGAIPFVPTTNDLLTADVNTTGVTFTENQPLRVFPVSKNGQLPKYTESFSFTGGAIANSLVSSADLVNGDLIRFTGTLPLLPVPLTVDTDYYVVNRSGTQFGLSDTLNGDPLTFVNVPLLSGNGIIVRRLDVKSTYYVREIQTGFNNRFKIAKTSGGAALNIVDEELGTDNTKVGIGRFAFSMDAIVRARNTFADNRVQVYNISSLGTTEPTGDPAVAPDLRSLSGTLTLRANCADPVTNADSACTPTSIRRGPSPVFIFRGLPNESIEFKGLQIKLDGVDPNNIFWVSSRAEERLDPVKSTAATGNPANNNFILFPSNPNSQRIKIGKRIIFSDGTNTLPSGLSAGTPYYIACEAGAKVKLSLVPPPAGGYNCNSVANEVNIDGDAEFKLGAEPAFVFEGMKGRPNIITGNFLGYTIGTGTPTEDNTSVFTTRLDPTTSKDYNSFRGVRFLGLWGDAKKVNSETLFVAMTSVEQPQLLPVVQLSVPNALADGTTTIQQPASITTEGGINGTPQGTGVSSVRSGQWTIRPVRTEINIYFVAGNSPARNEVPYRASSTLFGSTATGTAAQANIAEAGGGLANFVRFLENWADIPIKITGGFIQNTKSRFATAPFAPTTPQVDGISDTTTVFLNPAHPGTGTTDGRISGGYNLQYQSFTGSRIPYYAPPNRLWGYDVGLLTQQPDRFAERFAVPIPGANEFFREVSADDKWVEGLLCALEPSTIDENTRKGIGVLPTNYRRRTLRGTDLKSSCNSSFYGGAAATDGTIPNVYQ